MSREPSTREGTTAGRPLERRWHADRPISLRAQLDTFRRGAGDPTFLWGADGSATRAVQTPAGPGTLHLVVEPGQGTVVATAWGPGAGWLLEHVPDLLGAGDDPTGFTPLHPALVAATQRFPHWRVARSGLVVDALVPTIIEQKVTGQEAFAGYRTLVRRFGEPAPGPFGAHLLVPPTATQWARIPSWEWLQAGVDPARSRTVVAATRVGGRLQECLDLPLPQAHARLRAVPGIGIWTAAEVAHRALGDADAVSFGDYHVAKDLGLALVGRPLDDVELAEVLTPYVGHRYRVQALIGLAGFRRERHGARMAPRTHLPRRR